MIHKFEILNGIRIDCELVPLIKSLWNQNIRTIQCCHGDDRHKAHLMFDKNDLEKVRDFLPKETVFIYPCEDNSKFGYWLNACNAIWAEWNPKDLK